MRPITPGTCYCGAVRDSLCDACARRSFVIAAAERRPGLLAKLDAEHGYDAYETATAHVLRRNTKARVLNRVVYNEDMNDVDWFVRVYYRGIWGRIFYEIELEYERLRGLDTRAAAAQN